MFRMGVETGVTPLSGQGTVRILAVVNKKNFNWLVL